MAGEPPLTSCRSAVVLAVLVASALPVGSGAAPPAPASGGVWYDVSEGDFAVAGERWIVPQAPNTAMTWPGHSSQAVTWNVASTTVAPVSCATVAIALSTDGGLTHPTLLATGTPNDGAETILVPNISTTTARVRVACVSNVFFDISNVNFSFTPSAACPWADINCSCGVSSTTIDVDDLIAAANAWTSHQATGAYTVAADVDCQANAPCVGANGIRDVGAVASMWDAACP